MKITGKLSPQEFWARMDEGDARVRAESGALPLFGVADWTGPRMTGDWGWVNDRLTSAGLAHGDRQGTGAFIHVKTTTDDPTEAALGHRMGAHLPLTDPEQFPTLRNRLRTDPGTPTTVTIDDEPHDFHQWSAPDGTWLAAGHHGETALIIEASAAVDITQLRLIRVTDIEPYIAGRRAHLRRLRGEDA
ncbi:hypothetical protein ABH935_009722 [Catenulispora sp. GAS73]|uniref:hypothetical protein n=1 Tax=Catenulispora sp. GAS73 TaxID=3156269 RepID=UPI0035112780